MSGLRHGGAALQSDPASRPLCAGALSEWLADHPVMINNVLPLVLQALGNPELSISSVSTLKKICRECKYDLPPYAANIVAVSQVRRRCGPAARGSLEHAVMEPVLVLLGQAGVWGQGGGWGCPA